MENGIDQHVYIIDTYSKYDKDDIVEVFNVNGNWYAIKRVELYFGRPILSNLEKNEDESLHFHLYESLDDAIDFMKQLKKYEGMKF